MTRRFVLAFALIALGATQETTEPYPGQREHKVPPDGWYCEHQNVTLSVEPSHVCVCERACDPETGVTTEDRGCTVWCHRDHCHCALHLPPCGQKRPEF